MKIPVSGPVTVTAINCCKYAVTLTLKPKLILSFHVHIQNHTQVLKQSKVSHQSKKIKGLLARGRQRQTPVNRLELKLEIRLEIRLKWGKHTKEQTDMESWKIDVIAQQTIWQLVSVAEGRIYRVNC